MTSNYWQRWNRRQASRRNFLGGAAAAGAGAAGLALVGCGDDDSGSKTAAPAGTTAAAGGSPATGGTTKPAASPSAAAKKGGRLQTVTSVGAPPKLDPHSLLNAGLWDRNTVYAEKLLYFDVTTTTDVNRKDLIAGMSDKWQQPDNMTAVLNIAPNGAWHNKAPLNGRAVRAADVKATMDRILDPANKLPAGNLIVDFVDKIEAPDEKTVKITMKRPFGALFEIMAASAFLVIIPEEGAKGGYDLEQVQIGSGSFVWKDHQPGVKTTFDANPKYRKNVNLDGIDLNVFEDANALIAATLAGKLDLGYLNEGTDPTIVPKTNYTTYVIPSNIRFELAINRRFKPFDDKRVRQAMRLMVDQDDLLNKAFNKIGTFMGIIPPSSAWSFPEARNRQLFKTDMTQAKQLLDAAGFTGYSGKFVHFAQGAQVPVLSASGQVLAATFAKLGFKMTVEAGELATVLASQYAGDYTTNIRPNAGNTGNGLYDWTYKSEHTNGLFSVHNTKNMPPDEHLNDLCLKAVGAFSKQDQDAINEEFQTYMQDQSYFVPLGIGVKADTVSKKVNGWGYHAADTQIVYSAYAGDYWLA